MEYELHLRRRNRRAKTIRQYRFAVAAFVADHPGWRTTTDVLALERWLDGRDLKPASRAWWVSCLRGFYQWARALGIVDDDLVARELFRPPVPPYLPRPKAGADVVMAVELAGGPVRLALALMVYAGLRCCEVAWLRWEDVDLNSRALYLEGKGGRRRWVPIHPLLVGELADVGRPHDPVLGIQWTPDYVSRVVQRHLASIGVVATAHQLRHTFATAGYQARRDILAVSRLLGHRNVATTMVYVGVDDDALRATVDGISYSSVGPGDEAPTLF